MFLILVLHQVVRRHQQQMTKINLLLCFKRADVLSKGLCFCCGEILLRRKFGTAIELIQFFYFFIIIRQMFIMLPIPMVKNMQLKNVPRPTTQFVLSYFSNIQGFNYLFFLSFSILECRISTKGIRCPVPCHQKLHMVVMNFIGTAFILHFDTILLSQFQSKCSQLCLIY